MTFPKDFRSPGEFSHPGTCRWADGSHAGGCAVPNSCRGLLPPFRIIPRRRNCRPHGRRSARPLPVAVRHARRNLCSGPALHSSRAHLRTRRRRPSTTLFPSALSLLPMLSRAHPSPPFCNADAPFRSFLSLPLFFYRFCCPPFPALAPSLSRSCRRSPDLGRAPGISSAH